jgi:pimeloyl-ACP methyl ester carboxylesterase
MDAGIPKTRWAKTIDGANIAYQDFGDGPLTLVMIHAWLSHLEVYWEQPRFARFMRRLSRNLRVIHFDKRGVGMSERMVEPPTVEAQMDDVRAVVEDAGVERAALLGLGGCASPLAAFYAATYPDRTIALCLGTRIHQRRDADFPMGWTVAEEDEQLELMSSAWGDEDHVLDFVHAAFGDRPEDAPLGDPDFLRWVAKHNRCAATPLSYKAFDRMWFDTDVREILPVIHVPTAVLLKSNTDEDERDMARYILQRIPSSRLVEVPGTAYVVWVEDPNPSSRPWKPSSPPR